MKIKGVILAGGQSLRLGRDKTQLRLPGNGLTLVENAAHTLKALDLEVYISARASSPITAAYPQIMDSYAFSCSMCGVASSLKKLAAPCLVLPCDLPLMDPLFLRRLLDAHHNAPPGTLQTVFRKSGTQFLESLVSIYEPDCLPWLEQAMAAQDYMLHKVIPREHIVFVDYQQEDERNFLNINTPEDLNLLAS